LWVAPRLQTDVAEMKVIADLLMAKYGRQYADVSVVTCAASYIIVLTNHVLSNLHFFSVTSCIKLQSIKCMSF